MKRLSKAQIRLLADAVHFYRGRMNTSDYLADCGGVVLRSTLEALLELGLIHFILGDQSTPRYCIFQVTDAGRKACREAVEKMEAIDRKRARESIDLDDLVLPPSPLSVQALAPAPPPKKGHTEYLLEVCDLLGVPSEPWATMGERAVKALHQLLETVPSNSG